MAKISKKLWLRVLVPTALIIALILLAIPILMYTLDTENLRQTLTTSLSQKTGFKVDIQSMGIDLSQGLGVSADGISIHTADGKHHLFSVERLFLQAKLLPLLVGKFKIKNAVIEKPVISIFIDQPEIMRPQSSEFDLESLEPSLDSDLKDQSPAQDSKGKVPAPPSAKPVPDKKADKSQPSGKPEKNAARQPPEKTTDAKNQEPKSPGVEDERIIDFLRNMVREYDFTVKKISVKNGLAHVIKRVKKKNKGVEPLKFSFNLKLLRPEGDQVHAILDQMQLELGKIILRGNLQAKNILSDEGVLKLNLKSESFAASELKHIWYFLPGDFSGKMEQYPIEGRFNPLILRASIPLNSMEDPTAFFNTINAQIQLEAQKISMQVGKWKFPIDHLESTGVWKNGKIKHRIKINSFGGEILLVENLHFSQEPKTKNSLILNSKIKLTQIDLSKISSPRGSYASGTLSGLLKMQGSLTPENKVALKGYLLGKNIDINNGGYTFAAKNLDLKINSSSSYTPILDANLNDLEIYNIPFKAYTGRVAFPTDRVVFLKSILIPPHGKIGWTGTFHTNSMKYKFQIAGRKLRVEDFESENVHGALKISAKIHGYIPKKASFSRGISGNIAIRIWQGSFKKLDAIKSLLVILNPTSIFSLEKKGLGFDLLGGDITLDEGMLNSRNITLEGDQLNIYLKGLWDIPSGDINMDGKFLPSPDLDKILRSIPIIGQILAGNKRQEGFIETYFKVRGDISEVQVRIQAGKSIFEKPGRMLSQIGKLGD